MEPKGLGNHDLAPLNYWYITIVIIIITVNMIFSVSIKLLLEFQSDSIFFSRLSFAEQDTRINVATVNFCLCQKLISNH